MCPWPRPHTEHTHTHHRIGHSALVLQLLVEREQANGANSTFTWFCHFNLYLSPSPSTTILRRRRRSILLLIDAFRYRAATIEPFCFFSSFSLSRLFLCHPFVSFPASVGRVWAAFSQNINCRVMSALFVCPCLVHERTNHRFIEILFLAISLLSFAHSVAHEPLSLSPQLPHSRAMYDGKWNNCRYAGWAPRFYLFIEN